MGKYTNLRCLSIPQWKDPVIYQTTGEFSITLGPDEYQISLEHGMVYIPVKEKIRWMDDWDLTYFD
jgi:hypothetical protein